MEQKGIVLNIQRFTIHDGPGLRTELFFKGCPLRCEWCGNPESQKINIELGVYKKRCLGLKKCGLCQEVCPKVNALTIHRGRIISIDSKQCEDCYACVSVCPTQAIKQWGERMSVDECMDIIRKDKGYYERSGGGITVSGGEALLHINFIRKLFLQCKVEGIHTCFESAFHSNFQIIEQILDVTDLFIVDIKHMNSKIHQERTGVGNEQILANLKRIALEDKELILRIPIIPNFNDSIENMEETAKFIEQHLHGNIRTLQLLSFLRLGEEKYTSLGKDYPMKDVKVNRSAFQKKVKHFAQYMNDRGIHCIVGTNEA